MRGSEGKVRPAKPRVPTASRGGEGEGELQPSQASIASNQRKQTTTIAGKQALDFRTLALDFRTLALDFRTELICHMFCFF